MTKVETSGLDPITTVCKNKKMNQTLSVHGDEIRGLT